MALSSRLKIVPRLFMVAAWAILSPGGMALAEVDPVDDLPGADRPPVGRSLFDHLVSADGGARFDIPSRIEDLIAKLEQKTGVKPKVVMVPKGRSLQRDKSDFEAPRLVYAFDSQHQQSAADLGGMVMDRLYLGYAEKANQIEIVSYNAAAGRYEFQIVRDYREGGAKELVYANRGLCTKCHHNGAPIFSQNPWPETNGVRLTESKIADLIASAGEGKTSFHGVPVRTNREGAPYDIDKSVVRANYISAYQKLWTDGCGGDKAGAAKCRADVVRFALELAFTSPSRFSENTPAFQALKTTWQTTWAQDLQGGIKIPNPKLVDYFPLDETGTDSGFADLGPGITADQAAVIRQMLATSEVPRAKDPLFQFLSPLEIWRLDSICYGKCLIYGVNRFFTNADKAMIKQAAGGDFAKVTAALDGMAETSTPAFANRPFRRGVVMKELLRKLGQTVPSGGLEDDAPVLPSLVIDGVQEPAGGPPLALIKSYCLPCHAELPGSRSFLKGTDEQIKAKITGRAREIYQRVNWEDPPTDGRPHMPPVDTQASSAYGRMKANPEHRTAIKTWAKCLAEPSTCPEAQGGP